MKSMLLEDKPVQFPTSQVQGAAIKPVTDVLLERRATPHFRPDPVPEEYLNAILRFAAQAPSGYNLQPWRFLVVRDPENRRRLQKAAFDQAKVGEAPVVIIAFAVKDEWKTTLDIIFDEGVARGWGSADRVENQKKQATQFLETVPAAVWLNRHTMIAFTTMMLVAEAYGFDTAPMEGFDPDTVKSEFGLPASAEVVALLAIGKATEPDKPYAGRLSLDRVVHSERYGEPWPVV
jgi:nitroreductase